MAPEKDKGFGRSTERMNLQTPIIESPRLLLRPIEPSDAEALFPSFSDPQLMTYWSSGPHSHVDQSRKYIATGPEWPDGRGWAVTFRDKVNAIGRVVAIHKRDHVSEIGYLFSRKTWGTGVAIEAVTALITHLFQAEKHRKLIADVDPDNAPSIGLLERLGFQQEGYLRAEWETHIGVRDSLLFGLLASDWKD